MKKLGIIIVLSSVFACGKTPEGKDPATCEDAKDNDFNGRIDCEDVGCATFPECVRIHDEEIAKQAKMKQELEAKQSTNMLIKGLDPTFSVGSLMVETKGNEQDADWEEAKAYCEALNLSGQNDWRLPDVNEAVKIVKSGILSREESYVMWTSTQNRTGKAVIVGMSGAVNELGVRFRGQCRARCVRQTAMK